MFEGSTWFGPTGPSSAGASINCVLLVWYVRIACCSVSPYVRRLQTSSTQFIDAPEDGPVGPKHVELLNTL